MGNLQKKNIDLLRAYRLHTKKKTAIPEWAKLALPLLVVLLLFASVFAYGTLEANRYQRQIKDDKAQISTLEANGTNEEITKLQKAITKNRDKANNLEAVVKNLETYPKLQRDAIDKIVVACGSTIDIKDLTFVDNFGTIVITAQTPYVYDTADFITRLKESGVFRSVDYTGYNTKQAADTTENKEETNTTTDENKDNADNKDEDKKTEDTKTDQNTTNPVKKNAAGFYEMSITCSLKVGG